MALGLWPSTTCLHAPGCFVDFPISWQVGTGHEGRKACFILIKAMCCGEIRELGKVIKYHTQEKK